MEQQKHKFLASQVLRTSGVQPAEAGEIPTALPEVKHTALPWRQLGIGIGVLVVLVGAWLSAGYFFGATSFGSKSVSLRQSDTVLTSTVNTIAASFKLSLQYPDGSKKQFAMAQMGLKADAAATVAEVRVQQHTFYHRLVWWQPIHEQVVLHVDTHVLHDFIAKQVTLTVQPAKDATIAVVNGEVQLSDASAGKEYGLANPAVNIANYAGNLQSSAIGLKALTITPALTSQELATAKTQLEKILNQNISFNIGGTTVTPTKNDIAMWLELTPDDKKKTVDVDINSGKVLEYINRIAAANVHPPRDQIVVANADGSTSVLVPGVNGIDVTAKQDIASDVSAKVLGGKGAQTSLPVSFAPYKTVTAASYPKWIEVDLTNKRMYAYETTNLVKTFLVTAGAPATPTVTGQYAIYAKYVQQDMRGYNVDGSKYFQPNVPWINYFYKDYAIHGNYWRPLSYFGNINSSHGCVSVVPSEAEWIYDWAPIGTPVIIHN